MKALLRGGASPNGADASVLNDHALLSIDSALIKDVRVTLQAHIGAVSLSIEELLALHAGSVLTLDTRMNETIEIRLNETVVARGEIVAVDDQFGVRIVEIAHR